MEKLMKLFKSHPALMIAGLGVAGFLFLTFVVFVGVVFTMAVQSGNAEKANKLYAAGKCEEAVDIYKSILVLTDKQALNNMCEYAVRTGNQADAYKYARELASYNGTVTIQGKYRQAVLEVVAQASGELLAEHRAREKEVEKRKNAEIFWETERMRSELNPRHVD